MSRSRQKGTTSVEFAIIGSVAFLVLLGAFEMCRLMFITNALNEATRRGARVAVVCPINDPQIAEAAVFRTTSGTDSPIVNGLSTDNIQVEYLNDNGVAITGDLSVPANFLLISYVRVGVQNFGHKMILPVLMAPVTLPVQPTTLPRESLGIPRAEAIQPCP